MGDIRPGRGGRYEATVVAPTALARAAIDKGNILVGWGRVRGFPVRPRPLKCHRCLARGHVAASCPAPCARTNVCFRCGEPGHVARECGAGPKCPVCAEAGRSQTSHRAGSWECPLVPPIRRREQILEVANKNVAPVRVNDLPADKSAGLSVGPIGPVNNAMEVEQAAPPPPCNLNMLLN
ncbi:serine/arginine-rich splicing factor RS2Z33-like [Polistes fuscatus]|uniref:serine/arginine-rich splicing factor RS2Z33-like n=1 Tax=Polistes fuscatus TaxID=30207 RepID=UPI001CA82737|nr:serine/arginine-rich splicing factor RS2Z33-like [Polistes fuscatus]